MEKSEKRILKEKNIISNYCKKKKNQSISQKKY